MLTLLWAVCLLHWYTALKQQNLKAPGPMMLAVSLTLFLLGLYKYADFFLRTASQVGGWFGASFVPPVLGLILPLGISFYSFQLIAYSVDARERKFPVERNPFDLFLFVMFFPHLIAGPICRPAQLIPQLKEKKSFSWDFVARGGAVLAVGLFLKVCFADGVSGFSDRVFANPDSYTPAQVFQGVLAYTIQILCDFWGYSTMAIGSAMMFGIKLPQNFNLPYSSTSLQDFWRRWHMTLSFWLRDYLYIRLGGSRSGELKTYRNLLITMVLGGLWHGSNWTFVIWGLIHGLALSAERGVSSVWSMMKWPTDFGRGRLAMSAVQWMYTMTVVVLAWIFFRATTFSGATAILRRLTHGGLGMVTMTSDPSRLLILAFIPLHLLLHREMMRNFTGQTSRIRAVSLAMLLAYLSAILASGETQKFIYFDF